MRARREKRKLPSYRRRVGFIIALVGGEDTRGALNDANSDLSIEGVTVLRGIATRLKFFGEKQSLFFSPSRILEQKLCLPANAG